MGEESAQQQPETLYGVVLAMQALLEAPYDASAIDSFEAGLTGDRSIAKFHDIVSQGAGEDDVRQAMSIGRKVDVLATRVEDLADRYRGRWGILSHDATDAWRQSGVLQYQEACRRLGLYGGCVVPGSNDLSQGEIVSDLVVASYVVSVRGTLYAAVRDPYHVGTLRRIAGAILPVEACITAGKLAWSGQKDPFKARAQQMRKRAENITETLVRYTTGHGKRRYQERKGA